MNGRVGSRSWVDALIAGIERLPGPAWVFYVVVTAFFGIGSVGIRWLDGSVPFPGVDPVPLAFAVASVYPLAIVHLLTRAAQRSLDEFRPALGELEPHYDELRRHLTTMPQWSAVVAAAIGVVLQSIGLLGSDGRWGISADTAMTTTVFTIVGQVAINIFFWVFIFRAARQLSCIVRIHRDATEIHLYDSAPHNAFSRFTLATAVSLTVPYVVLEIFVSFVSAVSILEFAILAFMVAMSIAVFVLPLNGMHRRLVAEKSRQLAVSNRYFELAAAQLHAQVTEGTPEQTERIGTLMTGIALEGDRIRKVSTWPWSAETLRGLVSSVAIPVLLFAITTVLGRFI